MLEYLFGDSGVAEYGFGWGVGCSIFVEQSVVDNNSEKCAWVLTNPVVNFDLLFFPKLADILTGDKFYQNLSLFTPYFLKNSDIFQDELSPYWYICYLFFFHIDIWFHLLLVIIYHYLFRYILDILYCYQYWSQNWHRLWWISHQLFLHLLLQ